MATGYRTRLLTAIEDAKLRGWEVLPGTATVRYTTTHDTPDRLPADWWGQPSYERHTFLSFVGIDSGRAPSVVHGDARSPWTDRRDTNISFKRALEILATDDPHGD